MTRIRTYMLAAGIAVLPLGPTASLAQPAAQSAPLPTKVGPWVPTKVADGVHALIAPEDYYGPAIGNVVLIEQSDGFVVVDSGLTAGDGRRVVAFARYLAPAKPIKAVAITHWHNDHPQGISAIRDAFPDVRIIATEATEKSMLTVEAFDLDYKPSAEADASMAKQVADVKANYAKLYHDPTTPADRKERVRNAIGQFDSFLADFPGTYIVPPNETFRNRLLLDDPLRPIELRHVGLANTDGDVIAWLPNERIVASGDIVVYPIPFGFGSFPGQWIETLGKLKAMNYAALIPGHGKVQRDTLYLDKLIATIADIRAVVGPLAKGGVPQDKIAEKGNWDAVFARFSETPRQKAQFEGLFRDPMIPNAYKEALGRPIVQGEGSPKPSFTPSPPPSNAKRHDS